MKLGKLPAQHDKRTLRLSQYVDSAKLRPIPATDDNYKKLSRMTMACNDNYGCCVVSGAVHMVQVWSSMAAKERIIPDRKLLKVYLGLTGGADIGLNVLSFLNWWRSNPIDGHPLGVFVAINPTKIDLLKAAIHLFGAVYTGLGLPVSAQNQKTWDVVEGGPESESYSWGGHLTICGAYDQDHLVNYTWGEKVPMTHDFIKCYCDEAYALLGLDWFRPDHKSPDGFAWKDLLSDLAKVSK